MKTAFRKLIANSSGMAAAEFALVLPVLLFVFLGIVEGSDALRQSRRVTLGANTLADLVSQETSIKKSAADDLFKGVEQIVSPSGDAMTIRLVSVIANPDDNDGDGVPDGNPIVHWSYDNSAGEPYAAGAAYGNLPNAALVDPNSSLIIAEIDFPYTPALSGHFISAVGFDRIATRWPRRTFRVQLCTAAGSCTH